MKTPQEKIENIIERLGIIGTRAASVMKITPDRFRKNMSANIKYQFTEQNYDDLIDFFVEELKYLLREKVDNTKAVQDFEHAKSTLTNIFKNYKTLSKEEDWDLIDEILKVLDFMDESEVFSEMKNYSDIIKYIEFETSLIRSPFMVVEYSRYILIRKRKQHNRWYQYYSYRRNETIADILNS